MWKQLVEEFKEFALKGNAFDMAVGIVIGSAFGKIVTSLVNDLVMPLIGLILGGVDFSYLFINLSGTSYENLEAAKEAGASTLNYGLFLQTAVDFIIVAFSLFLAIKTINTLRILKKEKRPSEEILLLREIRDFLKKSSE